MSNLLRSLVSEVFRLKPLQEFGNQLLRTATKRGSGGLGNKNAKRSKGQGYGIQAIEGQKVFAGQVIVKQPRLRYHPGLNVVLETSKNRQIAHATFIRARKKGIVRFTCEIPNLDFSKPNVQRYYAGRSKVPFYKKYVHVITPPQHDRFKCIERI